jgi:hypothetical protein
LFFLFEFQLAFVGEQSPRHPVTVEIAGANPVEGVTLPWANQQSRLLEVQEFPGASPGGSTIAARSTSKTPAS